MIDEEPRLDAPATVDTVWEPGGEFRAVELTLDVVRNEAGDCLFFYVRVVGPAQPGG